MRNIKIIYSYNGSCFYGFQRQLDKTTIQGNIENAIFRIFNEKINLISSGRTDRGVHAIMQVSNFMISKKCSASLLVIMQQLNKSLKGKIKIHEIEEVDKDFNSRYMAKNRVYLYVMKNKKDITVFENKYISGIKDEIDIDKFNIILSKYLGIHDFASFMKKDKVDKLTIREINKIYCEEKDGIYKVYIHGKSFLKSMVRIMIGSALAEYYGEVEDTYIINKLNNPDANKGKKVAPAEGLYLYKVEYDEL